MDSLPPCILNWFWIYSVQGVPQINARQTISQKRCPFPNLSRMGRPRMLGTWFVEVLTNALSGNRYEQRTFPSVLEHDFQVKKTTEATPTWSESGEFHPRWFNVFTPVTIRCTLRFAPRRDDPSSPLYVQALQHWHCIHRFPQAAIWKFARQATPQRWASEHCQEIRNCSPTGEKSTQQIIYKTWLNEMIPNRSVVSDDCTIDNADVSFLFLFGMMISINNSIYNISIYLYISNSIYINM